MSIELLSPDVELESQEEHRNEAQLIENLDQEIECPRCHDIMTLSSDFDKLLYACKECDLLLMMK